MQGYWEYHEVRKYISVVNSHIILNKEMSVSFDIYNTATEASVLFPVLVCQQKMGVKYLSLSKFFATYNLKARLSTASRLAQRFSVRTFTQKAGRKTRVLFFFQPEILA